MINVEQIAIEIGYSYLEAGYGKWQDGSGNVHKIDSMSDKYLQNCSKFIDRGVEEIERGDLDSIIKEKIKEHTCENDVSEECLENVKEEMIQILQQKKEEIEDV